MNNNNLQSYPDPIFPDPFLLEPDEVPYFPLENPGGLSTYDQKHVSSFVPIHFPSRNAPFHLYESHQNPHSKAPDDTSSRTSN